MATFWDNRTIKAKLLLGIGAILGVFAISCAVVLIFVNGLAGSADRALGHILPLRAQALETQVALLDADDNAAYYIMDPSAANLAADLHDYNADIASIKDALPKLADGAETAREHQTVAALTAWFDDYTAATERSFQLKRAGKTGEGIRTFIAFPTNKGQAIIADFADSMKLRAEAATVAVRDGSRAAVIASIAGAVTAIVAGAVIAFALGGSLSTRLKTVTQAIDDIVRVDFASLIGAMRRFAAGDLSASVASERAAIPVRGKDETALLAQSYNSLVDGIKAFGTELSTTGNVLSGIIGDVRTTVDAAAQGNFGTRLNTAEQRGVYKELGDNLNRLMHVSSEGLNEVARVLGALAQGDLTQTITKEYKGTFGQLKDDSNETVASLTRIVTAIKEAADVVCTSAREISAGNGDLSQRTEEQAASLEETAASMEQLTATVHQNAENARQANQLAIGASGIAVKGGQMVGEVVQTMAAINESAKKIVEIISVIDGIAFQTNILALNAAVEAARAGEQGRGFAVVAGEVRTLAQRSASAAKEIKALIADSVEKTDNGTRLVGHAGETMAEIVESVKRVTDIMSAIAAASLQQGSGIGQVNDAVAQMDKVTQQNSALVEEIAASAVSLEERSSELVGAVQFFTLAHGRSPAVTTPRTPLATSAKPHGAVPARSKKQSSPVATAPRRAPEAESDGDEAWSSF